LLQQQPWQNIVHPKTFWKNIKQNIHKLFRKNHDDPTRNVPKHSGIPIFQCRRKTRFGAGPNTLRINTPFTISEITNLLSNMNYTIDFAKKRIVSTLTTNTSMEGPESRGDTKTEL
jgi:hypothetical protein